MAPRPEAATTTSTPKKEFSHRLGSFQATVADSLVLDEESVRWVQQKRPVPDYPNILYTLDRPVVQILNVLALLFVVGEFAFILAVVFGLHKICSPVLDCEPRNTILNIVIHHINILGTALNIEALPWRWFQYKQLRDKRPVHSTVLWWNYSHGFRAFQVYLLLGAALTQFLNHLSRMVFYDHESSNAWPGVLFCNLFIGLHAIILTIIAIVNLWKLFWIFVAQYKELSFWDNVISILKVLDSLLKNAPLEMEPLEASSDAASSYIPEGNKEKGEDFEENADVMDRIVDNEAAKDDPLSCPSNNASGV